MILKECPNCKADGSKLILYKFEIYLPGIVTRRHGEVELYCCKCYCKFELELEGVTTKDLQNIIISHMEEEVHG